MTHHMTRHVTDDTTYHKPCHVIQGQVLVLKTYKYKTHYCFMHNKSYYYYYPTFTTNTWFEKTTIETWEWHLFQSCWNILQM